MPTVAAAHSLAAWLSPSCRPRPGKAKPHLDICLLAGRQMAEGSVMLRLTRKKLRSVITFPGASVAFIINAYSWYGDDKRESLSRFRTDTPGYAPAVGIALEATITCPAAPHD